MSKTTVRFVLAFVGAYVLLALALIATDAFHGINDQDASFVLWLLVYYMNLPSVWLLGGLGVVANPIPVAVAGVFQWSVVAVALVGVWRLIRSARGQTQQDNEKVEGQGGSSRD